MGFAVFLTLRVIKVISIRLFGTLFSTLKVNETKVLAHIAQVVEHVLGKDEVTGSSPVMSSR